MEWLRQRRFQALLLAMLLMLVVYPALSGITGSHLLSNALLTLVFLSALQVVFAHKPLRLLALLLAVPTLVGAWTGYVLPGLPRPPFVLGFHLVAMLFLAYTVAEVLRGLFSAGSVS